MVDANGTVSIPGLDNPVEVHEHQADAPAKPDAIEVSEDALWTAHRSSATFDVPEFDSDGTPIDYDSA
jgi:hypothetical protein